MSTDNTTPKSSDTGADDLEISELDGVSGGLNPQPLPPDKMPHMEFNAGGGGAAGKLEY